MNKKFLTILSIFLCLIFVVECISQESDQDAYNKDIEEEEAYDSINYLTGNWGGFRGRLNDMGITPEAVYYMSVLGNPVGGKKKGIQYAGLLNAYLKFDLDRLLGIKRANFIISGSWASGRSLSDDDIGNFFTVSQVFSGRSVRLYQLFLETEFIEDVFRLAVGRMGVADEFSASDIFYNYVSTAINGHPISFPINDEGFFSDPQASWAVRMKFSPYKPFYIRGGVYNSNPKVGEDDAHGVDFSFKKGVIIVGEVGYLHNEIEGSDSLPGRYTFGAFYDTRDFEKLSDESKKERGNYGLYWIFEQMIYRETYLDDQGLTPWTAITVSPDEKVNTFPFFISGGFVYKGLFPDRNRDKTSFGFAYGTLSNDLENKDYELMFEITHMFQTTPWLQIQPDVQWVVHPGGSSEIPNALVIGIQMVVDI